VARWVRGTGDPEAAEMAIVIADAFQGKGLGTELGLVLAAAAFRHGVKRFLYVASSSCYGIPAHYPTAETAAADPRYPYALTKYLGEQLVMHWAQVYRLPAVSVRFFNVYGPRARTSGTYGAVFGVFLAQLLAGEPLTVVGDGEQTRDFTFVADVVDALLTVAESDKIGEIYNVGRGSLSASTSWSGFWPRRRPCASARAATARARST